MTERIKHISVTILCITLSICAALLTWRLNGTLKEVRDTAAVMHGTADELSSAVKEQVEIFQSPAYQKNYEHASELGDIAAKTVAQIARQTIPRVNRAVDELTARLVTLDGVLVSVRGISDEARVQVKQNGDKTAQTIDSLNLFVKDSGARITKLLDDGSLMIETASPKLQDVLAHLDAVVVTANGTIEAYKPVAANLTGITSDFNAMTTDRKNKLHEILYPTPVKGF